ncbi:transposase [Streptomyces sp. NA02950]|nr:transposase [Streptomyces sp. NA02950]
MAASALGEGGEIERSSIAPPIRFHVTDRHILSRKKSDRQDAVVLANILRTDAELHRPLPGDSDLVRAIAVLARAQQDAVGTAPAPTTGSDHTCVSTTPRSSRRSQANASGCCPGKPARSWRSRPPRPRRAGCPAAASRPPS